MNALTFPDHHNFTDTDIQTILKQANGRKIITTEKDYMRLQGLIPQEQLFYLPIKTEFMQKSTEFNHSILKFILEKC